MPSYAYYLNNQQTAAGQSAAVAGEILGSTTTIIANMLGQQLLERFEFIPVKGMEYKGLNKLFSRIAGSKTGFKSMGLVDNAIAQKANIFFWRNKTARMGARAVMEEAAKRGIHSPGIRLKGEKGLINFFSKTLSAKGEEKALRIAMLAQGANSILSAFTIYNMGNAAWQMGKGMYSYFENLGRTANYLKNTMIASGEPLAELEPFVDSEAASAMREVALQNMMNARQNYMNSQQNEAQMISSNPYKFYRYMGV